MLEPLVRLAERERWGADAYFESRAVRWAIALDQHGSFRGITPLGTPEDKRWAGKSFPMCPRTPNNELQAGGKSHFLAEAATTVLLLPAKNDEPLDQKCQVKHNFFKELVKEAVSFGVTTLKPIAEFLDRPDEMTFARTAMLSQKRAKPTDTISFDLDRGCVLGRNDWHVFWRKKRGALKSKGRSHEPALPCLATGCLEAPVRSHGKIKGVWGALGTGASLIANDKEAFQSFGLKQALNAPVSVSAESRYRADLKELIGHSIPLGGAQFIYWTLEQSSVDPVTLIRDGEEAAVDFLGGDEKLLEGGLVTSLEAVRTGVHVPLGSQSNTFYGCAISANGGRLVIRDWWESSVKEVLDHVSEWIRDLEIIKLGGGVLGLPKFGALLYSMVREDLKELPPQTPVQLMRAALRGLPLPRTAVNAALYRHAIEVREGSISSIRMCLIKAYLNRARKAGDPTMTTDLNSDEADRAYRCGRLLAVFEQIQRAALPKLNAGIVQRFYGAASSTPALVMPRLFKLSHHHLSSLSGGLAGYFKKQIEQITTKDLMGTTFPRSLTLEEQGRFALGYYHQRADPSNKADESPQTDQGGNDQ